MTAVGRTETRVGVGGRRLGSHFVVGVVALAIGMAAAYGLERIGETQQATAAQQTATSRGAAMTTNLSGLWESGLAQQAAMRDQTLIQGRVDSGLARDAITSTAIVHDAWTMRGREMPNHFDALTTSGLAQGAGGATDARSDIGEEMANHLDALISSGLAQQRAIRGS